jgi:cytochrome b6-f complex iron-sulfur subunit
MHRKDFIKGSCGVCIALSSGFLMSALLESCKTPLGIVKTSAKDDVVLIPLAEFEKADYMLVRVSNYDYDLAVQKMPDGSFQSLMLMCTHARQPLTKTGDHYYCTLHGSQFDHNGNVTKGPAEKSLVHLPTSILKDHISIQLKGGS